MTFFFFVPAAASALFAACCCCFCGRVRFIVDGPEVLEGVALDGKATYHRPYLQHLGDCVANFSEDMLLAEEVVVRDGRDELFGQG